MVKTVKDIQFLGVNGSQLTTGQGLTLDRKNDGTVVVRREGEKGFFVIYPANIAHLKYTEADE